MSTKIEFPFEDDDFVFGTENPNPEPLGFSVPKMIAYLKQTGKKFEELTEEELEKLK